MVYPSRNLARLSRNSVYSTVVPKYLALNSATNVIWVTEFPEAGQPLFLYRHTTFCFGRSALFIGEF